MFKSLKLLKKGEFGDKTIDLFKRKRVGGMKLEF